MKKFYLSARQVSVTLTHLRMGGGIGLLTILLSLLFSFNCATLQAQDQTMIPIQGVILDETGQPFAGVTVVAPNTTGGTTTDAKGTYRITVPKGTDSLRVSFIGYKTLMVNIRDAQLIHMEPEVATIEDVVVTGIFTRKAESYTGSATTIKGDELRRVGNKNLFQSLRSLDASLNILTNLAAGSDPNVMPDMQLRGTTTFPNSSTEANMSLKGNYLGSANMPLFILDGFETTQQRIFNLDMNRVASVTILKDASAKAIYGMKAANGVVVVETKPLLTNETLLTYTGSISLEMPDLTSYNLCNALEKLQAEKYEGFYESATGVADQILQQRIYNQRLESALAGNSTYWLSKPLQTGISHRHSISAEFGERTLKSTVDFSYNKVNGAMKGSDHETIAGDIALAYRYKSINFRNITSISNTKGNDSPYGSFSDYVKLNPYWTPYDENGILKPILQEADRIVSSEAVPNPLYDATLSTKLLNTSLYYANNFIVDAFLVKGLKVIGKLGISGTRDEDERFYPANHSRFFNMTDVDDLMRRGSYAMTYGKSSQIDGTVDLQYAGDFGKHSILAAVEGYISEQKITEATYEAEGFPSDRMNNITFARQYAEGTTPYSVDILQRNLRVMGNISYTYDNRYVLEVTGARNASSSLGSNNKWGSTWSAGAQWNAHNEQFLRNISGLDAIRLGVTYGRTGNPNFSTLQAYSLYRYITNGQYNGNIGATLMNMENPNLMWQMTTDFNTKLTIEYKALSFTAEYYRSVTKNTIESIDIAPSTGFSSVQENVGEVTNRGFEFQIGVYPWRSSKGFVNINVGFKTNKNWISKLSDAMQTYNNQQLEIAENLGNNDPVLLYQEGKPINAIYAVPSLGIDPMNGKEVYINKDGEKTYTWSKDDMVYCGQTTPKYNGTINLNAEYKGFGITASAIFNGGSDYYNYTLVDRVEDADIYWNVDRRVLTGRWLYPGQIAKYSALKETYQEEPGGKQLTVKSRLSSRFVQRNNELSITSVGAYYEFNSKVLQKLHLKRLRLQFTLEDLTTLSTIRIERGTSYPFARNMSFSLSGTF